MKKRLINIFILLLIILNINLYSQNSVFLSAGISINNPTGRFYNSKLGFSSYDSTTSYIINTTTKASLGYNISIGRLFFNIVHTGIFYTYIPNFYIKREIREIINSTNYETIIATNNKYQSINIEISFFLMTNSYVKAQFNTLIGLVSILDDLQDYSNLWLGYTIGFGGSIYIFLNPNVALALGYLTSFDNYTLKSSEKENKFYEIYNKIEYDQKGLLSTGIIKLVFYPFNWKL